MESTIDAAQLAGSMPPADLSLWGLFLQADIIVKLVMLILLLASFWSWAIIFEKGMRLKRLNTRARQFEESFWSGGSLEELFDRVSARPADPPQCANGGARPPRGSWGPISSAPACSSGSTG
jgi:biopolymer transport protein TolQ